MLFSAIIPETEKTKSSFDFLQTYCDSHSWLLPFSSMQSLFVKEK